MNKGYIKLHRKVKNSKVWYYTDAQFKVFITILTSVNWTESWARHKGEEVKVEPGQMVTSRNHLVEESGTSKKVVRDTLTKLEKDEMIETQRTSDGTLLTVLNWQKYQENDNDRASDEGNNGGNSEGSGEGINEGTHEEVKEGEKIKEVYEFWNESNAGVCHRGIKSVHKKSVRARLRDGFTVDELKKAIENLAIARNSEDYYWSHKWTLKEFMSRQEGAKVEQFLEGIEEFEKDKDDEQQKLEKDWEEAV